MLLFGSKTESHVFRDEVFGRLLDHGGAILISGLINWCVKADPGVPKCWVTEAMTRKSTFSPAAPSFFFFLCLVVQLYSAITFYSVACASESADSGMGPLQPWAKTPLLLYIAGVGTFVVAPGRWLVQYVFCY